MKRHKIYLSDCLAVLGFLHDTLTSVTLPQGMNFTRAIEMGSVEEITTPVLILLLLILLLLLQSIIAATNVNTIITNITITGTSVTISTTTLVYFSLRPGKR